MTSQTRRVIAVIVFGSLVGAGAPGCSDASSASEAPASSERAGDVEPVTIPIASSASELTARAVQPTSTLKTSRTISNVDHCAPNPFGGVGAYAWEKGHWAAARLTPPSYPFDVQKIRYGLRNTFPCNATLPHRVQVFVAASDSPPPDPNVLATFDVKLSSPLPDHFRAENELPNPIRLNAGDRLFVAVQMTRTSDQNMLCMSTCTPSSIPDPPPPEWGYWSAAVRTPYRWLTIAATGISGRISAEAVGTCYSVSCRLGLD